MLAALQDEIVKLAHARTQPQVVALLLRSACDVLGYARAIYFSVDRERGIEARAQTAPGGGIEPSDAAANLQTGSPFFDLLRGERTAPDAPAGDTLPLSEVRGAYVLSPLRHGTRTLGILYADDRRDAPLAGGDPSLLHALTAVAAASLESGTLLERATELATLDPLTGLLNRRALAERLRVELDCCRRDESSLAYAIVDVDDLKRINDAKGHALGDAALAGVAAALLRNSRAGDVVGRWGGDEFVVMLPGVDRALAGSLIQRLSRELEELGLHCSIGAAVFPSDAADGLALALAADRALYATKAAGKNGFSFA